MVEGEAECHSSEGNRGVFVLFAFITGNSSL